MPPKDTTASKSTPVNPVNQVYIPASWNEPTHQPGAIVWHNCQRYEITGVAPNHEWQQWSYTVLTYGHHVQPDYINTIQGYLLEHQIGNERPAYCDEIVPEESGD